MSLLEFIPISVGYILCILAIVHALKDASENLIQRLLFLFTLFFYGTFLEAMGIITGNYYYAAKDIMMFGIVPLSVTLAWVGIIYSSMIIGERLGLKWWQRILAITLIALSLDWGMDPIAVQLGAWTWIYTEGDYFGIPGFNFIGWFFIPIGYLIPYGLNWNSEVNRPQLFTIEMTDKKNTLKRKVYTLTCVVPIAMGILFLVGIISKIPILYDMPLIALIIWVIITILIASGAIILRRGNLKRTNWFDLIPPSILTFIGLNYVFYGFLINRFDLGILMLFTGIPLWLAFIFTLIKK